MVSILKVNDRIFCFSVEKSGDFIKSAFCLFFGGLYVTQVVKCVYHLSVVRAPWQSLLKGHWSETNVAYLTTGPF